MRAKGFGHAGCGSFGGFLMNRSLKLSALVALALASTPALALELGQIQVKSALGRPLVAEIPLQPEQPGEADHVKAILAPDAAFARAGVNRAALKVPLSFEVTTTDAGQKVIRVTSSEPVREPYLDFLVQVTWPKGKLLREYTVLLDPLSMHSAPGVVPAKAPAPPAAASTPAPPAPAPSPAASSTTQADQGDYGPVAYGDTLSHIARARAIDGVSYQQMLIALKAANPDAFFRDNVNALKTGAVLRIPTREQALAVTRSAAIAAVRSQNQSWQGRHAPAPTTVASAGGSSQAVAGPDQPAASGDRLHLVSPESGAASAGAAGGGDATAADLRQDLARSKEALSSQKQAAADLQSRVTALEQIADKNKRLLALKNDEIAALQQKLAEARDAAGLPALPASALTPAASATASAASTGMAAAGSVAGAPVTAASTNAAGATPAQAGTVATTSAAAPADTQEAATPAPAAAEQGEPASAPWYATMWARVVLGVIIVLLILWMLLRRRKPASPPRKSLADDFGDSPLSGAAAAGDVDDDDGEDELLAQLAEHPDNIGLHLELASLYYARRDAGRFEGAAEAMHAYVDDEDQPEWRDVVVMGRELVPDHPLFLHEAAAGDETAVHDDDAPFEDDAVPAADPAPEAEADDVREADDRHDLEFEPVSEPSEPDAPATSLPD